EIDKHEWAPFFYAKLRETHLSRVPVLYAFEFRLAEEAAVERIRPCMIGTPNHLSVTATFREERSTMAAHIGERPQNPVFCSRHQYRFAGNVAAEIVTGCGNRSRVSHRLPRASE